MALRLRYAARSDVGMVRPGNEDSGYAGSWLLAVADGMGGHAAGELASAMAVASFAEVADAELHEEDALSVLGDAVDLSSDRIAEVIAAEPQFQGMGTTFTGLAWLEDRLALVHVGDSRAYRYRDGELVQITKDHTYVQTLVDSGQITKEEAGTHPRRNLIMRAIDGIRVVEPDLSIRDLQAGDRYLLCSDGLTGVVSDEAIAEILSASEPTIAVTHLVEAALEGGAPDNVTVVVAKVVEVPDDAPPEPSLPVVVGAAGERRNRERLPNVPWPVDEQFDPEGNGNRGGEAPTHENGSGETPAAPGKPLWKNPLVLLGGSVVLLALVLIGGILYWVSTQWYVGVANGNVAVYQGVPSSLGPIPLQRLNMETAIAVSDLPTYDQERVTQSIMVDSQEQAISTVTELEQRAQQCNGTNPPAGCPVAEVPATGEPAPTLTPTPAATP